jgi:hypothetical protein
VLSFLARPLAAGVTPPAELRHRFSFSVTLRSGDTSERSVNGINGAGCPRAGARVASALTRIGVGGFQRSLASANHRRSLSAVDGRERIPRRLAIDGMRLGPDSRLFRGDTKSNANFYD